MLNFVEQFTYHSKLLSVGFALLLCLIAIDAKSETKLIGTVQGASHFSPFEGQTVTVKGTITSFGPKSAFAVQFTIQGEQDGNPKTSDAISVRYNGRKFADGQGTRLKIGDLVSVTGIVQEYQRKRNGGYSVECGTTNVFERPSTITNELPLTQIAVNQNGEGIKFLGKSFLPNATKLVTAGEFLPHIYDDDAFESFDIDTDYIDYFESLESMLVEVPPSVSLGPIDRFRNVWVQPRGSTETELVNGWRRVVDRYDQNSDRVLLTLPEPGFQIENHVFNAGVEFEKTIGIASFSFGNYKVLLASPPIVSSEIEISNPIFEREFDDSLVVATYNVSNLDPFVETSDAREEDTPTDDDLSSGLFQVFGRHISGELYSPDIVVLQEIQDDDGSMITDLNSAEKTGSELVNAIYGEGGAFYTYADVPPQLHCDGGLPGGNIRSAFLYNKKTLKLLSIEALPASNDAENVFEFSRKPIVGVFEDAVGREIAVIAVHLASKIGDESFQSTVPNPQRTTDEKRNSQAEIVRKIVDRQFANHPERSIIVAGDFNDFYFSQTLKTMKGRDDTTLTNAIELLPENDRWTYIYQGQAQALDHILIGGSNVSSISTTIPRLNTIYSDQSSDHDPILVEIQLQ